MTRSIAGALFLVAVAVQGHADDSTVSAATVSNTHAIRGPQETGEPGVERATGWLKLRRGTRVRLMVEDGAPMREVAGRLLSSDASTVTVDTGRGAQRFSRDKLFHLQYRTGGRDRQKGAAIGAAITGLAGMVAGAVVLEKERDGEPCAGCTLVIGLFGFAGAIPGGAIGFVIGAPAGEWRNSSPDGLTVTGAPAPRRATVALRFRF
jgi:hypothetical protein